MVTSISGVGLASLEAGVELLSLGGTRLGSHL